jgi:hypothetical protein
MKDLSKEKLEIFSYLLEKILFVDNDKKIYSDGMLSFVFKILSIIISNDTEKSYTKWLTSARLVNLIFSINFLDELKNYQFLICQLIIFQMNN